MYTASMGLEWNYSSNSDWCEIQRLHNFISFYLIEVIWYPWIYYSEKIEHNIVKYILFYTHIQGDIY